MVTVVVCVVCVCFCVLWANRPCLCGLEVCMVCVPVCGRVGVAWGFAGVCVVLCCESCVCCCVLANALRVCQTNTAYFDS